MYSAFLTILVSLGQAPVNDEPKFVESRLQLINNLPQEQFQTAKKIILHGGDVSPYEKGSIGISFTGNNFTDAELPLLAPFYGTSVASVSFIRAKVSDAGIASALARFPSIRSIHIFEMSASDVATAPLSQFHDLEYVDFGGTTITAASLRHMAHQPRLSSLSVSPTNCDDTGLKYLEGLRQLKWLALGKTKITSAGLVSLGKIVSLETLLLNDTQIDDEGLKHLESLQNLQTLRLDGTKITNRGMAHVAMLAALKDVDVERTQVNEEGIALLQNMPKLDEVRWVDEEKATLDQKRFHFRFHAYLPANRGRWKEPRERFERGELEIK